MRNKDMITRNGHNCEICSHICGIKSNLREISFKKVTFVRYKDAIPSNKVFWDTFLRFKHTIMRKQVASTPFF